ncbi:MAG TPA: SRPBCC family protein [Jiangellales bacterium]|nr:SRPBCC family protein [Jiangellales bacterium]
MPTDSARQTVEVAAPLRRVLATIRDVGSQPEWVPEVLEAEVLEEYEDGTPATAKFSAAAPVGTDQYTLSYGHRPDGMDWSLVEGRLQTGQDGRYDVRSLGRSRTEVSFELTISHHLPLPGFVRRRVVNGLVSSTLTGLKGRVEA